MRPLRVVEPEGPYAKAARLQNGGAPSDEELILRLAGGDERAIAFLYARYAQRIFNLAAQTLDRPAAEEIAQDVMLTVWRKAAIFDPDRGPFRPWVMRIAQLRIINELRRRSRRPTTTPQVEGHETGRVVDRAAQPDVAAVDALNNATIREALDSLPPLQRQALWLAFLEDLTHEQTAVATRTALGTTKTRIRSGLRVLRTHAGIIALVSASLLVLLSAATGSVVVRSRARTAVTQRNERALRMLASSEMSVRRLVPLVPSATGVPAGDPAMHAAFRSRPGSPTVVLTLSHFSKPPAGLRDVAWVRRGATWRKLVTLAVGPDGSALAVAEGADLATAPDRILIALESNGPGAVVPSTRVVVAWSADNSPPPPSVP